MREQDKLKTSRNLFIFASLTNLFCIFLEEISWYRITEKKVWKRKKWKNAVKTTNYLLSVEPWAVEGKKSFKLMWRWHQLLSGPRVSHRRGANFTVCSHLFSSDWQRSPWESYLLVKFSCPLWFICAFHPEPSSFFPIRIFPSYSYSSVSVIR